MISNLHRRFGFTLVELFAVLFIFGVILALALPAIQSARETQRGTQCANRMKQLGLALLNYEDGYRILPPISSNFDAIADIPGNASATTNSINSVPGSADSPGAGYSWMVRILPELEEGPLYQTIVNNSKKFVLPAFDPAIENGSGGKLPHCASVQLQEFICPSFTGGQALDTTPRTAGSVGGAVETGTIPPNYVGGIATANGADGIAITSYNAILGTHIDTNAGAVFPARSASLDDSNNGGMKFRGTSVDRGTRLLEITDGCSKTPLVAETRERRFTSWYDGTMNWVVAARHSNPAAGTTVIPAATKNPPPVVQGIGATDSWCIGSNGSLATGGTALNYGPTVDHPTAVYLPTAALADPDISEIAPGRLWGPSSQHRYGIVNHVFADMHVEGISDGIDPNVYLWIVTRAGGEIVAMTENEADFWSIRFRRSIIGGNGT